LGDKLVNKITISDVAKHAGVSKASVSYVLSGRKKLSDDVEERIFAAVEELGYQPPNHAPLLSKHAPKVINFCLPIETGTLSDDPYYIPLIEGALDYATTQGYHMMITRLSQGDETAKRLFYRSLDFVDGVLLCNLQRDHAFEQSLIDRNMPYVVNGTPDNVETKYYVDADIEGIAYQAATFLLKKGFRNIFYINLAEHLLQSQQRLSGFKLAHQDLDIPWDEGHHSFCNVSMDDSEALMTAVLDRAPHFADAVVTSNEIQARGAIKALQERQIAIPHQMAVVSMGGSSLAMIGHPKLTTIDFSPKKIGRETAKMLIEVIERKRIRPSHLIVPGKLMEREST
jgi:LacI family transcriptional regulator